MEKTASELVRFALDEAGFAEDAFNIGATAQGIGGNFNRKAVNAALGVRKGMKKASPESGTTRATGSGGVGDMTPNDWQDHIEQHHKGKTPTPGHCKYLDSDGNPQKSSSATSKVDAGVANETNVGTEEKDALKTQEQTKQEQSVAEVAKVQTPEQQKANEVLNKMGASTQSPELQAAYQAAQAKLNQPTPMKVEGVEGLEGMTLYPTSPTEADICGRLVAAAKAGSQTAKLALQAIQKQGEAGEIKGEETQEQQAEAPQVDPHEEWNKLLPTDPKDKLAAVEKEELERVQNLRKQMEQAKAEGKDTSKFEQRIEECKQKVLEARAEAEGRNLEQEAAEKAEQAAEAAKPKEMTEEEYAEAAKQYVPTDSKGMQALARKRMVDGMKALEAQKAQADANGKVIKDYFARQDAIMERYQNDMASAAAVEAKEKESAAQQANSAEAPKAAGTQEAAAPAQEAPKPQETAEQTAPQEQAEEANQPDYTGHDFIKAFQGLTSEQRDTVMSYINGNPVMKKAFAEYNAGTLNGEEFTKMMAPVMQNITQPKAEESPKKDDAAPAAAATQEAPKEQAQAAGGVAGSPPEPPEPPKTTTATTPPQDDGDKKDGETSYHEDLGQLFAEHTQGMSFTDTDKAVLASIQKMHDAATTSYERAHAKVAYVGYIHNKGIQAQLEEGKKRAEAQGKPKAKSFLSGIGTAFGRMFGTGKVIGDGLGFRRNAKGVPEVTFSEAAAVHANRGVTFNNGKDYKRPNDSVLLEKESVKGEMEDVEAKKMTIANELDAHGINVQRVDAVTGPAFTSFVIKLEPGVDPKKILSKDKALQVALGADSLKVNVGKDIRVTIPNTKRGFISFSDIAKSDAWKQACQKMRLPIMIGQDGSGKPIIKDLSALAHLLVSGTTNSGKSVFMDGIESALMMAKTPQELRFVHLNPEGIFGKNSNSEYNALPNAKTPEECAQTTAWLVDEMRNRMNMFSKNGVENIKEFNEQFSKKYHLPEIVVFADEYAKMMEWRGKGEDKYTNACGENIAKDFREMAAEARKAGIHLVIGTQRPDVSVIEGTMKSNLANRVCFRMANGVDYGTVLGPQNQSVAPISSDSPGTCYTQFGEGGAAEAVQAPLTEKSQRDRIAEWYKSQE